MKIIIIGAGAMGCLYGARLSEMGSNQVYLVDIWEEHIQSINSNGLVVEEEGNTVTYKNIKGVTHSNGIGTCDLAVIFVKSTITDRAVKENMSVLGKDTMVLTLQNGLGNIELIKQSMDGKNIIAGTTAHGATVLGPGRIRHAGYGKTIIGMTEGKVTDRLEDLVSEFDLVGIPTEISDNIMGLIWDKLLVNVGINALTAITGLHNGELLEHPETEIVLEKAVAEAAQVAYLKGIELNSNDPVRHTKEVCLSTAGNKSSMLQDVLNKRETEIDMINGAIVREGAMLGVDTPVNLVLTNLIKLIQKKEK